MGEVHTELRHVASDLGHVSDRFQSEVSSLRQELWEVSGTLALDSCQRSNTLHDEMSTFRAELESLCELSEKVDLKSVPEQFNNVRLKLAEIEKMMQEPRT